MVSVIIPVYNVEKYLRECVDSVLAQTYTDLEIILVDDGSPDNCGAICDQYAARDSRIKVIHKENGGLSDARNVGMDTAHGKYIMFLDSDDYIKKETVEELFYYAEKNKAEIVCFDFEIELETAHTDMELHSHNFDYKTTSGTDALLSGIENDDFIPNATSKFYNAQFIKQNGLYYKKGMYFEDVLFNSAAFIRSNKVFFIGKSFYYYRVRENSITTSKPNEKTFKSWLTCIRELRREATSCSDRKKTKALEMCIKYVVNMYIYSFCKLTFDEAKKRKRDIRYLRFVLHDLQEINYSKMKLKLTFPELFVIYRKTLFPIKDRIIKVLRK